MPTIRNLKDGRVIDKEEPVATNRVNTGDWEFVGSDGDIKKSEPRPEPVAEEPKFSEKEQLSEEYKLLTGRKPNKNMTVKSLKEKVKELKA